MATKATSKKLTTELVELSKKKYVQGGPHLWVSTLLHEKGSMSSNRIWEEFIRDTTTPNELI